MNVGIHILSKNLAKSCTQTTYKQLTASSHFFGASPHNFGLASAGIHTRIVHNSVDFLRLCKLTQKGSVARTYYIPVPTSILNIPQWNPLFKHSKLSCTVPSVTQMCTRRLKAAYHRLPVNKSVSSTVRAPGGIWQWVSITLSHNTVENLSDVSEEWNQSTGDQRAPLIPPLHKAEHNPVIRGGCLHFCGTVLYMCVLVALRLPWWKILCVLNCNTDMYVQHLECFLHWKGNHGMKLTIM